LLIGAIWLLRRLLPSAERVLGAVIIVGVWAAIQFSLISVLPSLALGLGIITSIIFLAVITLYWRLPQVAKQAAQSNQDTPQLTPSEISQLTSVEGQTWLKEKAPRVWDYVGAFAVITSEQDYQRARARLRYLLSTLDLGAHPKTWEDIREKASVESIALAILLSKKQFAPRKKRFWE
jgi:hypothetical protein